jgi:class 3 adenylate cyclase
VNGTRRPIEDETLALEWGGLRFRDPATEAAFWRWYALEAVPYLRLAVVASGFGWFIGWLALGIALPHGFAETTWWVVFAILPLLLVANWATRHPGRPMLIINGAVNMVGGLITVGPIAYGVSGSVQLGSLVAVVFAFFAFTIFRVPPAIAAPAVAAYLALQQVLVLRAHSQGRLDSTDAWADSAIPWVAYLTGLFACCVLTWLTREAFRRERVIEQQQHLIAVEQERSDALLRNVLPDVVAEQLKQSDELIADFFPEVTVLFADIVGFTELATEVPPRDLVRMLNEVFSEFDELTARRGAEKIKTIGDAYMAVAGVPRPRVDHVPTMADLALDMRRALAGVEERTGVAIACRFGLATGPAVAGVIGHKRFAYDLWGNTVNMAARMESHGMAGRIQVTSAVREQLAGAYQLEPRGIVDIKGAGPMETWFVEGRISADSAPRFTELDRTLSDPSGVIDA